MKKYIKATILHMGKSEILRTVSKDTLARIKEEDSNPEFRAYVIGHEGEADSGVIKSGGIGSKILRYVREAIVQMYDKVEKGCKIFHDHATDNMHTGRDQIGEVVGKVLDTIDGELSTIATMYIYPKFKRRKLDVASIEADIEMTVNEDDTADVVSVDEITGIALGNSRVSRPGFPGATLLGTVQAFTVKKEGGEDMKLSDIQKAIEEGKFKITDLFTETEIVECEPAKKAKQTEYEHAKRIEKKLGEERDRVVELTKDNDKANTELKELRSKDSKRGVKELFKDVAKTRNLDEKQTTFLTKKLDTFSSTEKDDKLKDDLNRFIDGGLKDYTETAKLFGIDVENKDDKSKSNSDKKGSGADDGKGGGKTDPDDLTSPENNDLIPG